MADTETTAAVRSRSDALAEFVCRLQRADVPDDVLKLARQHLLDSIGVAFAGSNTQFARAVLNAAVALSPGDVATVIGSDKRLPAHAAALANGVSIHTDDYDDTVYAPIVHPSSVIVATALAVGEREKSTADEVILAMVAGYEVISRVGLVAPGQFVAHGFHGTSVCGVFAAAAVTANLMHLEPEQLMRAFGIAGSLASGIIEYLGDGSSVKRFHPGWSAMSGISAAVYAASGVEGPHYVFEGEHGLYRSFIPGEAVDHDQLTSSLGTEWLTRDVAFKLYPMCHFLHAFADCVLDLRAEARLTPDKVRAIRCYISPAQLHIVCEPADVKRTPRTPYEAKFSIYYCMALALIDGAVRLADFTAEQITRADVLELASRVEYVADSESAFPASFSGRVEIDLADGTTISKSHYEPKGSRGRLPTDDELEVKFRDNAVASGLGVDADDLLKAVVEFTGSARVAELLAAFATPSSAPRSN